MLKTGALQTVILNSANFSSIATKKETLRQIAMDLLYRHGGLTNPEIEIMFGVNYSAVSKERRRLRMLIEKDRKVRSLLQSVGSTISRIEK